MTIEASAPAPQDLMAWNKELMDIQKEQHEGRWNAPETQDPEALARHAEHVRSRVRRGIELTALLRRSNTGPAKPEGARAKAASGTGKSKKKSFSAEELQAIEDDLLS